MKYKERPVGLTRKGNAKYTDATLVDLDRERFDLFCATFGGYKAVSIKIGKSYEYIDRVFRERQTDVLPFPTYVKICDIYNIPDKFLMGYGSTRDFHRWLNRNRPEIKKEKHAVCAKFCNGCMYSSKYSSLTLPVELGCDYMFVTGERRGCPAGTGCNRKTVGVNRQRPLTILY